MSFGRDAIRHKYYKENPLILKIRIWITFGGIAIAIIIMKLHQLGIIKWK